MWQLDSEATKVSSGSIADESEYGSGTTCGEEEAGILIPPSKCHWCLREYLLSLNGSSGLFCQ
jgi:hypothetical protein